MWPTATALGSLGRVRFAPADHHHARKQEGLLLFSISSAHIPSRVTKCAGQVSGESALAQSFESALLQAQQQAGPRQHTQDLQIEVRSPSYRTPYRRSSSISSRGNSFS
ncbi:hypothetical protein Vretifemale_3082 [Volvox reticuliferus]|uniref:Uncharacterized protein n=1 Tax=Volvox reticuliferus TaxID=1737510 RepID=A0A8J4C1M4_9CHLO|nr:hypothetical protein Vretifemale_3082 [Volvox reticuliferus]